MTGRRLYDHYCDASAKEFNAHRGSYAGAQTPLAAWPSLSSTSRRRWNDLAKRVSPKPRKRVAA